jgi:uncharacterized protein YbjT (DUF2867 family)
MTILVTGGTGRIGSQVIDHLATAGADVRVLTRSPEKARLPAGVTTAQGDLSDIDAARAALRGVSTLFLLVPNVPDELTQAIAAMNLARAAGVRGIVYLSVYKGEAYTDVPHFTGKHAVERMIEQRALPATVLRPAYFIQNDLAQKDALLKAGVYGMPIGHKGVAMVDTRDIAEAAATELLRRERADAPLPAETYDLVGPDDLTGPALAALWTGVLGREIGYAGDDLDALEQRARTFAPGWLAYDLRLMVGRYQEDGATATRAARSRLATLLGHPPRSYRAFAVAAVQTWARG